MELTKTNIKRGKLVFYARVATYEICELRIRTVTDDFFTGVDKRSKRVFLLEYNKLNNVVFADRNDALTVIKEAEKNKKEYTESYYEEY